MNLTERKQALLAKERDLTGEISRLKEQARDARSAEVEDPIDYVTSTEGTAAAWEIGSVASDTLAAVRSALARIDDGTYGTCIDCGEAIEEARLDAVPWTPYCLRDQEKHDREGQSPDALSSAS